MIASLLRRDHQLNPLFYFFTSHCASHIGTSIQPHSGPNARFFGGQAFHQETAVEDPISAIEKERVEYADSKIKVEPQLATSATFELSAEGPSEMAAYASQAGNSGQYHSYAAGAGSPGETTGTTVDNHNSVAVDPSLDEQETIAAIEQLREAGVSAHQEAEASQNAAQVASQAALAAAAAAAQKAQQQRRVPQACDACSLRKVKVRFLRSLNICLTISFHPRYIVYFSQL